VVLIDGLIDVRSLARPRFAPTFTFCHIGLTGALIYIKPRRFYFFLFLVGSSPTLRRLTTVPRSRLHRVPQRCHRAFLRRRRAVLRRCRRRVLRAPRADPRRRTHSPTLSYLLMLPSPLRPTSTVVPHLGRVVPIADRSGERVDSIRRFVHQLVL
jgi:hypothetical protein